MSVTPVSCTEPKRFRYERPQWGDLICGTKHELQALGLGEGLAFPSEVGGPPGQLIVFDPRGFRCVIRHLEEERFIALIQFPGRERIHDAEPKEFATGVTVLPCVWGDSYDGTAASLIAAGLVQKGQLPGEPGLSKAVVHLDRDGRPTDIRGVERHGGKTIRKRTTKRYSVAIYPDKTEAERRREAWRDAEADYDRRMAALPRPAPLVAPDRQSNALSRRQQLRLVWSRPAPNFTLARASADAREPA